MNIKKFVICLLCLFLLVGCNKSNNVEENVVEEKGYGLVEYQHYEIGDYEERCKKLVQEANDGTFDAELYQELYDEALLVDDLSGTAYVKYCENVNDEKLQEESAYMDSTIEKIKNFLASTGNQICQSEVRDEFKEYLNNEDNFNAYDTYKEKGEEELELIDQENDLIQEYNTLTTSRNNYSTTINGEEYTYDFLLSSEADELFEQDYDTFYNGYLDCVRQYNEDCGEIFLQLVQIRDKLAKMNGYENFAVYQDKEEYKRNYDISSLDTIKKLMKEYGEYIYFYVYSFNEDIESEVTEQELLENTKEIFKQVSNDAYDHFNIFLDKKLYSINMSDDCYDGSYMIPLSSRNAGTIFINRTGDYNDYFTLAHEFGHLYNSFYAKSPNPILIPGVYDILEIHSSGTEFLFSEKAQDLFGENYDYICANNIIEKLYTIVMACIFDDWQRYVYENPNATLDEINKKYEEISSSYGFYDNEYYWIFTPHNFDSPMYYMSYGVSFYTALQIWYEATNNFNKGEKIWEDIIKSNPYVEDYFEIVDKVGLTPFTDEEYGIKIVETALLYIDDVYAKYYDN